MATLILFEQAVTSLAPEQMAMVRVLHDKAVALGYACVPTAVGSKPGNYKIEYNKRKPAQSLLILRIDGATWSARLKLFHLPDYLALLDDLSPKACDELLSGRCGSHGGGCKGPVRVAHAGDERLLCRHGMQIKTVTVPDLPAILALLEAEDQRSEAQL